MNAVRYEDVDFDEFTELAEDGFSWINPLCTLHFRDNVITHATLESAWYGAGIAYEPFTPDTWYADIHSFPEMEGIDPLETYYTQAYRVESDFGEGAGMETGIFSTPRALTSLGPGGIISILESLTGRRF